MNELVNLSSAKLCDLKNLKHFAPAQHSESIVKK